MKCKKCKSENIRKEVVYEGSIGEAVGMKYRCGDCGNEHIALFDDPNARELLEEYFEIEEV